MKTFTFLGSEGFYGPVGYDTTVKAFKQFVRTTVLPMLDRDTSDLQSACIDVYVDVYAALHSALSDRNEFGHFTITDYALKSTASANSLHFSYRKLYIVFATPYSLVGLMG